MPHSEQVGAPSNETCDAADSLGAAALNTGAIAPAAGMAAIAADSPLGVR
jgi:hypothetical protein